MLSRTVGASGLKVSRMGLGTLTWGGQTDVQDARTMLLRFVEAGGSLIDTAPAYASGLAEKIIGRAIHLDLNRDDLVIATKAGFTVEGPDRIVDTSRSAMLRDLEGSLRRLRTDHVDLWQVHAWGDAPLEETCEALDHAVRSGMARYVGVSNFVGWQSATAATWQRAEHSRMPIVSNQVEYSLLARRAEIEVVPAARHHRMGVLGWSALVRGFLAGRYRTGTPRDSRGANDKLSWFVEPYLTTKSRAVAEAVAKAADGLGITPAQVALSWVRDAPQVASALVGPRTPAQLTELLAADEHELPDEITAALDDITGGPNLLR
ncbi:aldo/keto reductase [Acidipropionibacterium jensenii]|uniref:aldo/keto reductase n=1 Tax=Acidipropionibacterium jensenii TaxID=1749 RepID=UPI0026479C07|nr:aldo/keto reductase [Acidipropionibacterium jensenii]MDN5995871.1 aldo/keto reductase [Acidipropionibacterium jensenii]